jgi:hypothetical protein
MFVKSFAFEKMLALTLRPAFALALCVSLLNAERLGAGSANSPGGTQEMIELLNSLHRKTEPLKSQFASRERSLTFQQMLRGATDPTDILSLQSSLALELLNSGYPDQALRGFARVEQLFKENPAVADARNIAFLTTLQATSYIWLGEKENCLSHNNPRACLFPIPPEGVQTNQAATRKAIGLLTNHLHRNSSDLRAVWLLNIAHMKVGEYPDQVPEAFRIDPKVFASEHDLGVFRDAAPALGLDVNDLAGGSIIEDFDGDGLLDIMASSWQLGGSGGQLRLFRNNGDGTFTERTREAGLLGLKGGLNMMQADYNNNGHPDVFILRGAWLGEMGQHPNSLLRNNGDGTFDDVTEEAGLLSFHPTQTAVWFDYDGDGWIDLFIGNESVGDRVHPCELYRNNGDGTFTELAARAGVAVSGFVKGVVSGDFNNDGRPDLYLSIRGQRNMLLRNDGPRGTDKSPGTDWKFTDVSVTAGVTEPSFSFPVWFWDFDNDGWLDIFVSGYFTRTVRDIAADYMGLPHGAETPRLYRNNQDGTFTDVTREARLDKVLLTMGSNFGDLDNDGFLDFYAGTGDPEMNTIIPNRMFRNAGGKFFQDVTSSGGFGNLHKGHGISFGDVDNDGDQDIYSVVGGAYPGDNYYNQLLENPGHGNRWITLKLEGVQSNRAALGARIKVLVETDEGERAIYKTVSTGGSFGASPFRQEIGLGKARSIRAVEIFWPVTQKIQVLKNLDPNRFYKIREGDAEAIPWELKTFSLKVPLTVRRVRDFEK